MKKFLAAVLAVLTLFSVFTFTACSPSAEDKADEVLENLKEFTFESMQTDGSLTETVITSSETVLTQSGEKLSSSGKTETSVTEVQEKYNVKDGGYDKAEKQTDGSGKLYGYEFTRGGQNFIYSSKKAVESFKGVNLEVSNEEPEADSPELIGTVNDVIISMAKSAKAVSVHGDKLKVNLNAMLYGIVNDLNYVFENSDGNITVGSVFAHEKIKNYFSSGTYEKINEALSSEEFYETAAETVYIFSGGLISLPEADTLAEADITKAVKDFKKLTENVTKENFVITKTEKDIKTSDNTTVIYENAFTVSCSGAEAVYTVKDGAICGQSVSLTVNIEMLRKEDTSLSYAPEKNNVKTNKTLMTYAVSENVEYSNEVSELTDLSGATVDYPELVIPDGEIERYISSNSLPRNLFGELVDGDFNTRIKVYVDNSDNVTDVVAEPYEFAKQYKSSYNAATKCLTLQGAGFGSPAELYFNFGKHSEDGSSVLDVEVYASAADREAHRLLVLKGMYFLGSPFNDGSKIYYPVSLYFYDGYRISSAKVKFEDEKITELSLLSYSSNLINLYFERTGTVVVKSADNDAAETVTYYIGIAEDSGYRVDVGFYMTADDARAGSENYEFCFSVYRDEVTKTVTVEEYLSKNNRGDLL